MSLSQIAELASIVSDSLVALAAIVAGFVAIYGINQWRKELMGKARFEIARRMPLLALQYQDEFRHARNLITVSGESAQRPRRDDETPREQEILDEYFARHARLKSLGKILQKLHEASWEAEVVLGRDFQDDIKPLEDSFRELFAAVQSYFSAQQRLATGGSTGQARKADEDWMQSLHAKIYSLEDDSLSRAVDSAVHDLAKQLRKHIK